MIRALLIVLTLVSLSSAGDIPGAFGIKFGTPLKDIDVVDTAKTTEGATIYIVLPPRRIPFLKLYAVEVSQKDKRVYGIWGKGSLPSKEECLKLLEGVASQMEKEFGVERKKPPFKAIGYYFTAGKRMALVKCTLEGKDWKIYLQFYDTELEGR